MIVGMANRALRCKKHMKNNNDNGCATLICEIADGFIQSYCLTIFCMSSKVFGTRKADAIKATDEQKTKFSPYMIIMLTKQNLISKIVKYLVVEE